MTGWIDEGGSSDVVDAPSASDNVADESTTGEESQGGADIDVEAQAGGPDAQLDAESSEQPDSPSEPPSADQSSKSVPLPALQEERKQKQALKQQLDAAQKRINELQALAEQRQQQTAKEPEADPYESDDAILDDLPGALKNVRSQQDKALREWKINASEEVARDQFADYDDLMGTHYLDAVKADPSILQRVDKAAMPALAAYKAVKKYIETKDFNPDSLKTLQDENARLKQELEERKKKGTVVVPSGVANARAQGGGAKDLPSRASPRDIWPLT
jgi:hypothetical protein